MGKYIALAILVIPGIVAVVGVKLIRDTLFNALDQPFPYLWIQFGSGLLMTASGIAFVGGWIFYRDRKRHYVAQKFRRK